MQIIRDLEVQSAQKENVSRENVVKRSFEGSLSSENAKITTSSTNSKLASLLPGTLAISSTNTIPLDVKGSIEGSPSSRNAEITTPSTHSKLAGSLPDILVTSSANTLPHIHGQIKFNTRKSDVEEDGKVIPVTNLKDLEDDDLINMLQSMEDDYSGKTPTSSSVPTAAAAAKDELVAKALSDLEDYLKMPLKDIATSEDYILRLQTALNFLSRLSLEDEALSHEVMAIIKSMHKELPNILLSFKQAFATVNKFAELEERDKRIKEELTQRKEVATALVSKMSETQKFMDEAEENEARLKEQISRLEKVKKDCEAELFSLQEQKRKHIVETVEFKKEFETVRKEKSEMAEDERKSRQQLFQVDHKWSVLGSQFEQNIANRNL
ncbi:uncharacterized protein LOC114717744 [Neltuma alba]|uniref:uncharacterized protein LOC114717744 n=1 Tax=Neltuma alba TaxID=207710 RepID=UPI0010A2DECB|nr:uncharacterized protein LOC114717744 [Prosopis alba]